ncbi:MAG: hypothetical protein IT566_13335 [Rhodospirillaceae bacterium]|nr:hypothetical protein [Rhodospirillaceae bacterium]
MNVFDRKFAALQMEQVERDFAQSRKIVAKRWAHRPVTKRILESIAIRFRTQL